VHNMCTHTQISDCVQTVHELPLLPNTKGKLIYTNRSGAKCWLDSYCWGAGLAVTGPIRDIGQDTLLSALETGGSSSSPVTATFCYLWHSLRRSLLDIQQLYCELIIMCINNNNNNNNNNDAIIKDFYERIQDFILFFRIPTVTRRISSKFIDRFGMHPQKAVQPRKLQCL
jgi:hypothetical protein